MAYRSDGNIFHNKETSFIQQLGSNVIGFTRDISDSYAAALLHIGKGRAAIEDATKAFLASKVVNEGGRAIKYGLQKYQALLQKKSEVDSVVNNILGRNMAYANTGALRKFMAANARAREGLGLVPMPGPPVMLTPTNRLGGALKIGTTALSVASSMYGLGAWGGNSGTGPLSWIKWDISDRRLKDNIKQVGISPKGYKIYEFSYKGADRRFRGVMAQDVAKINPMAVGISSHNSIRFLTVDYNQIDVDMELV